MYQQNDEMVFEVLHLFCGSGGAALGMQQSSHQYKGLNGRFHTVLGIDNDPYCCTDFERLTGAPAACMDLFSREQYIDFHGKQLSEDWREVAPSYIRQACRNIYPDVVFLSPPCKGFSGLLPEQTSKSKKYQALNGLVDRSVMLVMEAFKDNPPAVIMIENVPRITSRGKHLLNNVKALLRSYGFLLHEGTHDCGELAGLGQTRKRYLLIARNPKKLPSFIYQPPKQKLKTIGDIIGNLPMPGDIGKAGIMHRLPNLAWKTWVRLALIPAGGDWRDLNRKCYANVYQIVPWDKAGPTVTGAYRPNNGAISIADPRINHVPRPGAYKIVRWEEPAPTITGSTGAGRSNGISGIADPRLNCKPRAGSYMVQKWNQASKTITANLDIHAGPGAIADPRIPDDNNRGIWLIISEDGTWHRPITTLEMAALQGLPLTYADGNPLVLAGNSEQRWREHIGNMVPPPTATAIGNALLETMMANYMGDWHWGFSDDVIWVSGEKRENIPYRAKA